MRRMRTENGKGIALMLAGTAMLSVMDAIMKRLADDYGPLEVAALRGATSLPFVVAWVLYRERGLGSLIRVRIGFQLARGLLAVLMLTSFVFALRQAPLSEVYALFFVAPLLITALSVPMLRETVDARRWLAVAAGFVGVLIVLRPGFAEIRLGALATLVGASCYALNAIAVRILGRTDSSAAMSFWFLLTVAVGGGVLALPDLRPLRGESVPWLLALGVTGAIGQGLLTEAFRRAHVSVVAPFEYFALLWALGLDLFAWRKVPAPIVFVGAAVIVGSGVYLMKRQSAPR